MVGYSTTRRAPGQSLAGIGSDRVRSTALRSPNGLANDEGDYVALRRCARVAGVRNAYAQLMSEGAVLVFEVGYEPSVTSFGVDTAARGPELHR